MSAHRNDIDTQRLMARLRQAEYRRLRDNELCFHDVTDQLRMTRQRLHLLQRGRGSRRLDAVSEDDVERCRSAVDEKQVRLLKIRREISRREEFLALLERCQALFSAQRPASAVPPDGVEHDAG